MLPALLAQDRLIAMYANSGQKADAFAISRALLNRWSGRYGQGNLSTLLLRARIARTAAFTGELKHADRELRVVLAQVKKAEPASQEIRVVLKEWLGVALAADTTALTTHAHELVAVEAYIRASHAGYLGEFAENYQESEVNYREAIDVIARLLGEDAESTASARMGLAITLANSGRTQDAKDIMLRTEGFFESSLPPTHWLRATPLHHRGRIELERQKSAAATALLDQALTLCIGGGCSQRIAEEIHYDLGRAHDQSGDLKRAIDIYRKSLGTYERLRGPNHVGCVKRRLSLADALRRVGNHAEAAAVLSGVTPEALNALPAPHLVVADHKRVQGLLWAESGEFAKSQGAFAESLKIFEHRLGSNHWRTLRTRAELAKAEKRPAP